MFIKWVFEIVVVGGYNVIFVGLFGVGKFMLVKWFFIIFLFMIIEELLEIIKIYLVVGKVSKMVGLII